ncbi:hypothetical protein K457DRAFT_208722 [Linnemannia elongata AG-77]|uniref:Uncharacterized protein n=1 Tax=Linnemannia elongata AG-77 TaxID=1314771 RepID=A0A197JEF4_9FUNG|nr:hypothetical protein K457DRAFT_208722 [Linnemannia elongata AG-77]
MPLSSFLIKINCSSLFPCQPASLSPAVIPLPFSCLLLVYFLDHSFLFYCYKKPHLSFSILPLPCPIVTQTLLFMTSRKSRLSF